MNAVKILVILVLGLIVCQPGVSGATEMGSAFTYQGHLYDNNSVADGYYDFQFKLYDAVSDGNQAGSDVNVADVDVIDGYFTVELDFGGSVFDGNAIWLEIGVRPGDMNDPNAYTKLSPRQEVTVTPYSIYSQVADLLDGLDSTAFAYSVHNHDSFYAPISHSHDGVYALIGHDHDGVYAPFVHVHDDRYYTEVELQSSGSASVHWDNLDSVPAGFADGVDNDSGGTITGVLAGTGLSGGGYSGSVMLDVEFSGDGVAETAARSDHAHDERYYTETELGTGGSADVNWDNLTNVPAGFADGNDDADMDWIISDSNMYSGVSGNVGIGTDAPVELFNVLSVDKVLDQDFSLGTSLFVHNNHNWQSFTPSITDKLIEIDLGLMQAYSGTVYILTGEGTGGTIISTNTVSIGGGWRRVDIEDCDVTAGQRYTIYLPNNSNWARVTGNAYPYGRASSSSTDDFLFRTYIGIESHFSIDGTSGNVGIGTAEPGSKLEVVGVISATSFSGSGADLNDIEASFVDSSVAGEGLTGGDGNSLDVNTGLGLEIVSDAVRIAESAAGNGLSGGGNDPLALGDLTTNWHQSGAHDVILRNENSELHIMESIGGTYYGILDVGNLSSDSTYVFAGGSGTVWTSGNDGAGSGLDADSLWGQPGSSYLTSETDPEFIASAASTIAGNDIDNWNAAYGWGDHSAQGYITGEGDPIFGASEASGISNDDIFHWNTAYSWGDHASAGYLTDELWSESAGGGIFFNDGNVGIGTSDPNSKLEVAGTIHSTSNGFKFPDGSVLSSAGGGFDNVVVVAKSGGDFTTIQSALNSITDNSSSNRYLVWVGPGTYNEKITMKQYVDIKGSGQLQTILTSPTNSTVATAATVKGANDCELSFVTVECAGPSRPYAVGIYNNSTSPRLTHLTVQTEDATFGSYGVYNNSSACTMKDITITSREGTGAAGVRNVGSTVTMENVMTTGSDTNYNYGIQNTTSSVTLVNVVATASGDKGTSHNYGMYNEASSADIRDSVFQAFDADTNHGIYNAATSGSYTVEINNSQLIGITRTIESDSEYTALIGSCLMDGGASSAGGGTMTCAGCYDENYTFSASSCP